MKALLKRFSAVLTCAVCALGVFAAEEVEWEASTNINTGWGDFAPFYIASNNGGIFTQPASITELAGITKKIDYTRRFDYAAGAQFGVGYNTPTDYQRYNPDIKAFEMHSCHAPYIWVQQLWGELKYRSLFISAGMKENDRSLIDSPLGSGDITVSRNARPIPQVMVGFIDFQDIPFTNHWVQIRGDIAYGKFFDGGWTEDHYNYYNSFITTGVWYHYKSCHFRTNPDQPFMVTVGMQHASQFGGTRLVYRNGELAYEINNPVKFKDFLNVFIQKKGTAKGVGGDEAYYQGNHLGSWDLTFDYRFANGSKLRAYAQFPWEDGSGIGKLNGFDGVWGLQYDFADGTPYIKGIAVEYLDFMNHSGPMHWAVNDHPGTAITGEASGADDYYNNYAYNGWQNYGMSIGSPMFKSPLYNTDGYMRFTDTRFRGFHIGANGNITPRIDWRVLASYRKAYGTPYFPSPTRHEDTSVMIEAGWQVPRIDGLSIRTKLAFDAGNMYGNNGGCMITVAYKGRLSF